MANKTITWVEPEFEDELGEYFENDYTRKFLDGLGITFESPFDLLSVLEGGTLSPISWHELKNAKNVTNDEADFEHELSDPAYARSFNKMQSQLDRSGRITLPAPILLWLGKRYYGFAGNRRMNLAQRNNVPLKCWVVDLSELVVESLLRTYVCEVALADRDLSGEMFDDFGGADTSKDTPTSERQMGPNGLPLAVCALVQKGNKFLSVTRKTDSHVVGMPGGGVDIGENPDDAVVRELFEETGLTLLNARCVFISNDGEYETHTYMGDVVGDVKNTAIGPKGFEGFIRWSTKEQLCSGHFSDYNTRMFRALGL